MARPQGPNHLAGLDGLRAIAALAVFGVHFDQVVRVSGRFGPIDLPRLFANGNHGVSLFFTLSGFLLSLPFWRARRAGARLPRARSYALRRVARIVPAYYLALTVLVLLDGYWRFPAARVDLLLHYAFLFNLTEFSIFSINAPFWTLAVEMQFYLLLPLLFLALRGVRPARAVVIVAVVACAAYGLHTVVMRSVNGIVPWPGNPALTWIRSDGVVLSHSLLAHLPHFLLGVAGGWVILELRERGLLERRTTRRLAELVFWLSLAAVLVILGTRLERGLQIPYGRYGLPLVPLLLAGTVLSAPMSRTARRLLDGWLLRSLGTISYGIYIWHVPCLNRVDRLLAARGTDAVEHWFLFGVGGLLLTIVAATVSHFVVERPVLRLAHRLR